MKNNKTPSNKNNIGWPDTTTDLINKYGTYEIQPTCENQSKYPQIAQNAADDTKIKNHLAKKGKKGK